MKKKILILGGDGFIGSIIKKKLKKNYHIKSISRKTGHDLRNISTLTRLLKINYDYVINSAAHVGGLSYLQKFGANVLSDNLTIYNNLYLCLSKKTHKPLLINLLSNCLYPAKLEIQSEHNCDDGRIHNSVESFAISKRVLLVLSKSYEKQYGIQSLNLIIPNAFGKGDHLDPEKSHALNGIIVRMIKSKLNNDKIFEVWGSGKPKREWIYAQDVAQIIKLIIKKNLNQSIILNIAQNKSFSINSIAFKVKKILKFKGKIFNNRNFADGAPIKQLCNKKFKKIFPHFKFANFDKALNKTIKSYRNVYLETSSSY
jgi:GDP-L-fucose synthase